MKPLGVYVEKFVPELIRLWLTGAKDTCDEVRNNSIFGLGEMILHGEDRIFRYLLSYISTTKIMNKQMFYFSLYPDILQALSAAVAKESHPGTLDNICGAICKMIITNSSGVPLYQVFPVLLSHLPLRDDYQENEAVVKCFFTLYQQGNDVLRAHLSNVIKIVAEVLHKKQTPNEGK